MTDYFLHAKAATAFSAS